MVSHAESKKWYKWNYLQVETNSDIENKFMVTKWKGEEG